MPGKGKSGTPITTGTGKKRANVNTDVHRDRNPKRTAEVFWALRGRLSTCDTLC